MDDSVSNCAKLWEGLTKEEKSVYFRITKRNMEHYRNSSRCTCPNFEFGYDLDTKVMKMYDYYKSAECNTECNIDIFLERLSECTHSTKCILFVYGLNRVSSGCNDNISRMTVIAMHKKFNFTERCVGPGMIKAKCIVGVGNQYERIFYAYSLVDGMGLKKNIKAAVARK